MVQQTSAGSLEMVVTGNTGYDPLLAPGAPYAFASARHMQKVFDSGVIQPFLEAPPEAGASSHRIPRAQSAQPHREPGDSHAGRRQGAEAAGAAAEVIVNAWKAVGANVAPLAFRNSSRRSAGTVEGQERPSELFYRSKSTNQKFMMTTEQHTGRRSTSHQRQGVDGNE